MVGERDASVGPSEGTTIKVAHLLDGFYFGGTEQMVQRLARAGSRVGLEAHTYCLRNGRVARSLRADGLPVRVFESEQRVAGLWVMRGILGALRDDGIDIVQAHNVRTCLIARMLRPLARVPNVTTIHSPIALDDNQGLSSRPLHAYVERLGRRWTDHVVAVGREEATRIAAEDQLGADRLTWIANGVDAPSEDELHRRGPLDAYLAERGHNPGFVVAMIAQLRPRKGAEVLLQAWASAMREGVEGTLLLVGSDEFTNGVGYQDQLRRLATQLGIDRSVCFAGFMEDPWSIATGADAISLPSLFGEGMSLALLEAMSRAIPLLASDTSGNRELVLNKITGLLHTAGDATMLGKQIGRLATDPGLRNALGEAARREFLAKYTLDQTLRKYRCIYELILRHDAPPAAAGGGSNQP